MPVQQFRSPVKYNNKIMEYHANLKFISFLQLQLNSDKKNRADQGMGLVSLFVPLQCQGAPGEVPRKLCTCRSYDMGH